MGQSFSLTTGWPQIPLKISLLPNVPTIQYYLVIFGCLQNVSVVFAVESNDSHKYTKNNDLTEKVIVLIIRCTVIYFTQ